MVEISVIVPTLKDRDEIACTSIFDRAQYSDYEVIVRNDRGASRARNEGIKRATSDKLVFLDDDSYPCDGYLEEAARTLEHHSAVAGRIIHPYDNIFSNFTNYYDHGDEAKSVEKLVGCNMAVRREVFETVGTFDEAFIWGHEDSELSHRIKKAYDIYYNPELVVRHCYAESVLDLWRKHYYLETHRSLFWEKQNIPKEERILRVFWRFAKPSHYFGDSLGHTLVKSGKHMAANFGRIRGMIDNDVRGVKPAEKITP